MSRILAENAAKAARAVYITGKKQFPVLDCIKVGFSDGYLTMTSFDWVKQEPKTEKVPARYDGETWETCVPMRALKDWLGVVAKSKEVLTLEFDPLSQDLTITTDPLVTGTKSRTIFKCIDAQDFPTQ